MRTSGILMHITSLPSDYGIGTLGKAAFDFVDFLKKSGQRNWQVLPICPTSYGDSPYQGFSTFAGNPYFIDLTLLINDKLLLKKDCDIDWGNSNKVDYEKIFNNRFKVLYKAFLIGKNRYKKEIEKFLFENEQLNDYCLFMALKEHFKLKSWLDWDIDIKLRKPEAIIYYSNLLKDRVAFYAFIQYLFFKQWNDLKNYANNNNIKIIGDIPIYTAMDSADAWANPSLYWLDNENAPVCVAGCPPDYFCADGQLWGNPLYNWDYMKSTGYEWWIRRIEVLSKLFDTIRIDHFRGFDSYYSIKATETTARNGEWKKGPGIELFNAIKEKLGNIDIIAEDLGFLTDSVRQLLKESGYPGMKILQFAFDSREESCYLPHTYEKNCVCYTGTHDNDTIAGWLAKAAPDDVAYAREYLQLYGKNDVWQFIRAAWSSVAMLSITQLQDFLGLEDARMNTPSTIVNNWKWRVEPNKLTDELASKIYALTSTYRRI